MAALFLKPKTGNNQNTSQGERSNYGTSISNASNKKNEQLMYNNNLAQPQGQ